MPDSSTEVAQFRLQIALRSLFPSVLWKSPLPPLARIGSARTLSTLRQILHQPVIHGFCENPCSWNWSSSLDLIGASRSPWMTLASIERSLGSSRPHFRRQFFNYLAVAESRSFKPHPLTTADRKLLRHSAAGVLAAIALSRRQTPFEALHSHSLAEILRSWPRSNVPDSELPQSIVLDPAEKRCLITPELVELSPLQAAYSALSSDTGKSGRALRSQASTTAGVASSKSGWMMESVV